MLDINLKNVFKLRNIEKPRRWLVKQGITPQNADRLLSNEQKHIKFSDLERICLGLKCSPTDLFIWQPDTEADNIPGHPLQAIRPENTVPDVIGKLQDSPLDELRLVDEFIKKLREGK